MTRILRDNGLSIALVLLFMLSLAGQSVAGFKHYNEDQHDHGQSAITYGQYISSSAFANSVFENWQSEFLQMALFVWLTSFLYQRGSAESADPDGAEEVDGDPEAHRDDPHAPAPVRAGGLALTIYQHSLSLALSLLFVASFVLHLIASTQERCEKQLAHGQACSTVAAHLGSATFWFESFQNWQSEFLSVAVVVILSIFLREKGSPESKPVHAPHGRTGR